MKTTAEITEYEQNRKIARQSGPWPIPVEGLDIFEVVREGQTKVTINGEFDVVGFF